MGRTSNRDHQATFESISRSRAVIEFNLDGTIIEANGNFLAALGYTLDEIVGQHQRMFCPDEYTQSKDYKQFWERLAAGEFFSAQYRRLRKDGSTIWIHASYNPIFDVDGNVTRVVKYAADITKEKMLYNTLVDSFGKACFNLSASAGQLMRSATQVSTSSSSSNGQAVQVAAACEEV